MQKSYLFHGTYKPRKVQVPESGMCLVPGGSPKALVAGADRAGGRRRKRPTGLAHSTPCCRADPGVPQQQAPVPLGFYTGLAGGKISNSPSSK